MATLGSIPSDRDLATGSDFMPPGVLAGYGGASAPAGWLLCDGAAISRTTYAALFAAIGIAHGPGNGTTTFNVPDCRGRVVVMPDGSAGRLTANDALGSVGGAETHTLAAAESGTPEHQHNMDAIALGGNPPATTVSSGKTYVRGSTTGGGSNRSLAPPVVDGAFDYGIGVGGVKGGAIPAANAHNNMQPYVCANAIIKT